MKRLLLLALFALPLWPGVCTLTNTSGSACASKACALSAIAADTGHANWTGSGCTATGYVPAAGTSSATGDTVTIPANYTLTVDQNWAIGANNASNGTAAITVANGGSLVVATGATLTIRGDLLAADNGTHTAFATWQAGSGLTFDASYSAAPSSTRYRVGGPSYGGQGVAFNGTSASHVTVTSVTANSALAGQFRNGNAGTTSAYGSTYFVATYTDFSYIGDGATYGGGFSPHASSGQSGTITVQHCTFNYTGPWYNDGYLSFASAMTVTISNNSWTNSTGSYTNALLASETPTTGSITVSGNVFDKSWNSASGCSGAGAQPGFTFSNNYFALGWCYSSTAATMTDNFIRTTSGNWQLPNGNVTGFYYLLDLTTSAEIHLSDPSTSASATVSGGIMDVPDNVSAQPGYEYLPVSSGSATITHTYSNDLLLPTKGGQSAAFLYGCTSALPPSGSHETTNFTHDTWVGYTTGSSAGFQMISGDEAGACQYAINQLESVLLWANGGTYSKFGTEASPSGPFLTNPITAAGYNVADTSGHLTLTNPSCTGCTDQGNGYISKWTATPGATDFIALPYFADTSRNVETWDTAYLRNPAGPQWATGLGYTVGQIVSDPQPGVYKGAMVNYRCIAAHTSGSTTEPNVGASWRTDWEFASLADIRAATVAGTNYVDGAIGCAGGCTAIQALEGWVKRGFTPQNPALWCAGHDGEAVGAIPFCAAGRAMIGTMGTMAGM